jgi:hypothetical protein
MTALPVSAVAQDLNSGRAAAMFNCHGRGHESQLPHPRPGGRLHPARDRGRGRRARFLRAAHLYSAFRVPQFEPEAERGRHAAASRGRRLSSLAS